MSKMTPFRMLTSYKEALETIQKSITPINRTELIQIEKASNRILAKDVVANMSVPPFDRAAMDGYAVRADETIGASSLKPRKLKLTEVLHAGASTNRALDKGECIQVATGSPIPEGADAVVMVEFTERHGNTIDISKPVYPRANISPKGEDIKKGQTILRSGEQILPARIGALAALGKKEVEVYQKPRIAVVSTGTEIQEVGCSLRKGQIYDVNSYTLFSIARRNMAIPMKNKIVPDTVDQLKETIEKLLGYDMIVLSGGSSVGERDLLMKVIQELGTVLFHGIQMKPGKPTLFALVNGKPVFGMPEYPTCCLLNACLLLVPAKNGESTIS